MRTVRQSRARWHWLVGLAYILAVFVSALIAGVVTLLHVGIVPSLAPLVQAFAWVTTTGMAWGMAARRHFAQHRQWMIRSYAVTTTFVSTRSLFSVPAIDRLDAEGSAIIILCALTLTLVATEVGIQLESQIRRKRASVA